MKQNPDLRHTLHHIGLLLGMDRNHVVSIMLNEEID